MITADKIKAHSIRYKTFNTDRFIDWLNEDKRRWWWYDSVSKATKRMHKNRSFGKFIEKAY